MLSIKLSVLININGLQFAIGPLAAVATAAKY